MSLAVVSIKRRPILHWLAEVMNIYEHIFNVFNLFIWQTILIVCAVGAWAEDLVAEEQYR